VNRTLSVTDRLRIERVMWAVDLLIYDIRTGRRRTIRGDLRANLRAAAREVGVGAAIRQLGPLRRLARGFVDAEYGPEARRPRWMGAIRWGFVCGLVIEACSLAGFSAFVAGVSAADPSAHGTFVWNQLSALGLGSLEVTFAHGQAIFFQGSLLPWTCVLYVAAAVVLGGRLWRLTPRRKS
jgi:hypothetical protein